MTIQATMPLPGFVAGLMNQLPRPPAADMPSDPISLGDAKSAGVKATATESETEAEKLQAVEQAKKAFKEFEGVFVSMLIKELRKGTELFAGDTTDSLGVLFDQHIGKAIGESGGIGIAKQLSRYLEAQEL